MKPKDLKDENKVYVKIEHLEAIQSKRSVLSSEMNLLKIVKLLKNYRELRLQELKIKIKLYQKMKEMNLGISSLKRILPKVKIPSILEELEEAKERKVVVKKVDSNIEYQLQEIRDKLSSLQEQ